jgi:crotonobetainyl-CoA:carnitine CoA-transferase CaiB-like acyl-CoA transferase
MGAEVIKIEKPGGGDDARGWGPPFIDGDSMLFHSMNRNKKSVTLDIKNPEDVAKLKTLVAGADILIQNLRAGVVAELGIGPDVMCALNPRLIYCSVWAFGKNGPLRNAPGFDPLLQAYGGVMSLTGRPDDPPTFCAPAIHRQGLRDRYRAIRQRGGVGRRSAQRLQPYQKTAAAVRRRQFYAGAVSGVRDLGPPDLHRRRQ